MSDITERLRKAAADFEAICGHEANMIDSDCEPHWSNQVELEEASQTALDAIAEIERLRSLATQHHQGGGPQVYTNEASNYNLPSEVIVSDSLSTALAQQPLSVPEQDIKETSE